MYPMDVAVILVLGLLLVLVGVAHRSTDTRPASSGRVCPADQCGHLNPRNAAFCAQCGRRLPPQAGS